jgi:hypothetical protein
MRTLPERARYPANILSIFIGWPVWAPTACNFLTRPPTGMPRRAISPGEGLCFLLCTITPSRPRKSPDYPSLRASSDHSYIVGALRTETMPAVSPLPFPACSLFSSGMAPVLVPLRLSSEHILIVRVPRAGGRPGCPFLFSVVIVRSWLPFHIGALLEPLPEGGTGFGLGSRPSDVSRGHGGVSSRR